MEPDISNESVGEEKTKRLDTQCNIYIHSFRHRLADADGVSAKAAIDGIVNAGVLRDDTTHSIKEVRFIQTKISKKEPEKTVIILETNKT